MPVCFCLIILCFCGIIILNKFVGLCCPTFFVLGPLIWAFFMEIFMKDKNFEEAIEKLFVNEGGYTSGTNQIKDLPTNMGIQQKTLDKYNLMFPYKNFPKDVKSLQKNQAYEIYKEMYWDNTKIPQIKNARIRNAVFDMNVMGGAGIVIQRALNGFLGAGLIEDGVIGNSTLKGINSISDDSVNPFMDILKLVRINYLKGTINWSTAKNGWINRTNKY